MEIFDTINKSDFGGEFQRVNCEEWIEEFKAGKMPKGITKIIDDGSR